MRFILFYIIYLIDICPFLGINFVLEHYSNTPLVYKISQKRLYQNHVAFFFFSQNTDFKINRLAGRLVTYTHTGQGTFFKNQFFLVRGP